MKPKLTIDICGNQSWRLPNGNLHNENGPAIVINNTHKFWFLDGANYSEQGWKIEIRKKKLKQMFS